MRNVRAQGRSRTGGWAVGYVFCPVYVYLVCGIRILLSTVFQWEKEGRTCWGMDRQEGYVCVEVEEFKDKVVDVLKRR